MAQVAQVLKQFRVQPNSTSLEEARKRTFEFFKLACRSIPSIMEIYTLEDVVHPSQLRASVLAEIRKNAHITNPKVIDLLLFKAMEELKNVVDHSKQRHHIIGQYVVGRQGLEDLAPTDPGTSDYLKKFYNSNYF
ncbi:hypothetical protein Leryth_022636 [Lithospermum erythrorhizon]|uniref:Oxidoreductase n=1 Tax=Lithospermum erythrorhizon TaxID=34254 RepID=A0AAV3Q5W0_LITER|nr:hypothetical protein Leryth_022636 [Lithospermum erythrorhizon]